MVNGSSTSNLAYAAFNSFAVGADFVVALPTTRVAVMGPAGVEYVYKDELRKSRGSVRERLADETQAFDLASLPTTGTGIQLHIRPLPAPQRVSRRRQHYRLPRSIA